MGAVYLAEHARLGRRVVVKVLLPDRDVHEPDRHVVPRHVRTRRLTSGSHLSARRSLREPHVSQLIFVVVEQSLTRSEGELRVDASRSRKSVQTRAAGFDSSTFRYGSVSRSGLAPLC